MASTSTTSQSHSAHLECGGTGDSHRARAADRSAATMAPMLHTVGFLMPCSNGEQALMLHSLSEWGKYNTYVHHTYNFTLLQIYSQYRNNFIFHDLWQMSTAASPVVCRVLRQGQVCCCSLCIAVSPGCDRSSQTSCFLRPENVFSS